ncbi:RepB family protein [Huintestinicola sp.]|jgi:predicted DNA-binding protein
MDKKVEYNKNYNKTHYKNINIRIKPETNEMLEDYCKDMHISKATFITNAIKYIIDNNIDITL